MHTHAHTHMCIYIHLYINKYIFLTFFFPLLFASSRLPLDTEKQTTRKTARYTQGGGGMFQNFQEQ